MLGDLLIFALFFLTYLVYRSAASQDYALAQSTLHISLGTINTLALLTSSWCIALGVQSARSGTARSSRIALWLGIALGITFLLGKMNEYYAKASAGFAEYETEFFMCWWVCCC